MENNQFWQFSDQLRLHTSNLANLSINDSIWSTSYGTKRTDDRRNFDIRVGGDSESSVKKIQNENSVSEFNGVGGNMDSKRSNFNLNRFNEAPNNNLNQKGSDFNGFNDYNGFNDNGWKIGSNIGVDVRSQKNIGINGGFNKGIYSKPSIHSNNINLKGYKNNGKGEEDHKGGKKNQNSNKNNNGEGNGNSKSGVDKRFKTLPPAESLPRNETVGGYIFVCNNDTMQENLKRQLFGLPPRYRDSVRAITPGLPLFLYNYSTHQLHGVFEAASFGGTNIDPTAWEDRKCPGESRFPAQVRVVTRKICEPLEEDSFRPILHHYDGPKFRLELNIPEALSLLDIFADSDA